MLRRSALLLLLMLISLKTTYGRQSDSLVLSQYFEKADGFMNEDRYDSAQHYLNQIYKKVSYRSPSLFSYLLTCRQAEIYYYNNLPELGAQEAARGIRIAEYLGDDILKGDAYNFAGLFHLLSKKYKAAISSFKKSISLNLSPPYPAHYRELSMPYHFYGNLAEVYELSGQMDSAVYYNRLSIRETRKGHNPRGLSTSYLNMANAFLKVPNTDSALYYYSLCRDAAIHSGDFDVELCAYSGLATCASDLRDYKEAERQLQTGFNLIRRYPHVNSYYALMFLEAAIPIYRISGNFRMQAEAFDLKAKVQLTTHNMKDAQIKTILSAGLNNENRILNLEVNKARQLQDLANTRLYFITALVLLLALAFAAYYYYSRQRLRMLSLRNKISQDLHDEVGATLSGIALYAHLAKAQNHQNDLISASESLSIINSNANEMVKKLSDIVWAVNPLNDSFEQLIQRLENYAMENGTPKGIKTRVRRSEDLAALKLPMELRKNVYLIGMEAVNNAIKYSQCQTISIDVSISGNQLVLTITDDGTGFDISTVKKGNGLLNMQNRAAEAGGSLSIEAGKPSGTRISLVCRRG